MTTETPGQLKESGSVTLDSDGNGELEFTVDNAWQRWEIDHIVVQTNQASNQAPYPTAEVFSGPVSPAFSEGASWTGNQDTFSGRVDIDQGNDLHIVWTGGIPGTVATARVTGTRYTRLS